MNPAKPAKLINKVRSRAVLAPLPANTLDIKDTDVSIDFILDERARELAGEQWRWFDLKAPISWWIGKNLYNPQAAANIKTYHTLRPIPQSQIDAVSNKTEFIQNPGYN